MIDKCQKLPTGKVKERFVEQTVGSIPQEHGETENKADVDRLENAPKVQM